MGEEMARLAPRFLHYRLPGTAAAAAEMATVATRPAASCRLSRCSVVRARASFPGGLPVDVGKIECFKS
jgi:hypothetical protein